ncbi:MAG: hypothetical protein HY655_07595 [Acidobacteria bacterium]|nr:hypothetical protein [Acidobacteriota bacterium]
MGTRKTWPAIAAAVLSGTAIFAQSSAQTPIGTAGQATNDDEMPITRVGCIQREADYRRTHDLGRGGVAGTGLGRGNEYVLINAARTASGAAASQDNIDCSFEATAEAYELTGERELEPFVGRVVQITGMLKEADVEPVGTSGATRPTGGFDPLGQDLRLHEVDVTSFQEVATAAQAAPAQPAPTAEPQPTATTGAEEALPRTASPLPVAGLLGLLSLGGALGVRMLRRR